MHIDRYAKKRKFGIKYHGYYCGPGWSDGRYQSSVCGNSTAIDTFDQTCKEHDCSYAKHGPHFEADHAFYRSNVGRGIKRTVAAVAVLSQNNKLMTKYSTPPNTKRKTVIYNRPVKVSKGNQTDMVNQTMSSAQVIGAHYGGKFNPDSAANTISKKMMSTPSGTQYQIETRGAAIEGAEIVWFGHASISYNFLTTQWCRAVVKALLFRCGTHFRDWNDIVNADLEGWTIVTFYHANSTVGTVSSQSTGTLFAGNSYETIAQLFRTSWVGLCTANAEIQPLYVQFQKSFSVNAAGLLQPVVLGRLWLDGQKMKVVATSRLAVQNTTLGQSADADNDTTQSITAAPLSGKIYEFKGNYARKIGANQDPLDLVVSEHVTVTTGAFNPTGSLSFSEPVDKYQFFGCTKQRKITMNPGEIKTDQFSSAFTVNIRKFFQNFANKDDTDKTHGYGHSHFFALEKQVFINATNPISVNVNCDNSVGVMLVQGAPYILKPKVDHVNYFT